MPISNEIISHFAKYPVFTYRDVELYLKGKGKRTGNLPRTISYLKSSGRLYTIRKGSYTLKRDSAVAGFAFTPFYYGLLSALTIRDLWTQDSRPEILTLRKVRNSRMHIFGDPKNTIFVHHVPAKYFFGFEVIGYAGLKVPVSDPEKTLIDLFYYKVRLSIQDYGGLLKAIDRRKLAEYLKFYDKHTSVSVTNFIKRYKHQADSGEMQSPY